jgi:hypothetical protein
MPFEPPALRALALQLIAFADAEPRPDERVAMARALARHLAALAMARDDLSGPRAGTHGVFRIPRGGGISQVIAIHPNREQADSDREERARADRKRRYSVMPVTAADRPK